MERKQRKNENTEWEKKINNKRKKEISEKKIRLQKWQGKETERILKIIQNRNLSTKRTWKGKKYLARN